MSESLFYNNFNGVFFLSLGTLFITATSVCLGFALKSKCSNVKICFGCLEIERDIDAEVDVEMAQPAAAAAAAPPAVVAPTDQIPSVSMNSTRRRSYNLSDVAKVEDFRNSITNTI